MTQNVDQIMDSIAGARNPSGFADRLAVGIHRKLILKKYILKDSQKNEGMFIEAEFIVEESNVHQRGETRGWAWFIQKPSFNGEAERGRNRIFVETAKMGLGDDRDVKAINLDMISPQQKGRGMQFGCEVRQLTNPDGSPKLSKGKQNPIYNADWKPIQQSLADIAGYRSRLDSLEGPVNLPSNQPAPAPTAPAANPWGQQSTAQPPWGQPPGQPPAAPAAPAQPPWGQAPGQPAAPAQPPWGQAPGQQPAAPAAAPAQPPWGQPPGQGKPPGVW